MENLRTNKCPKCGAQINGTHMKPPFLKLPISLDGFYGNRVKKFMKAVCDCGEEYIAYLERDGNSYKVIDLAYAQEPEPVTDITQLERKELMALAKEVGVEGKIATMKTDALIEAIREKQ